MVCYLSEIGHKNFYYATQTKAMIKEEATYEVLSWISGTSAKRLQAIKIKKKFIIPLTVDFNYVNNILDNNDCYVVVWINKGD